MKVQEIYILFAYKAMAKKVKEVIAVCDSQQSTMRFLHEKLHFCDNMLDKFSVKGKISLGNKNEKFILQAVPYTLINNAFLKRKGEEYEESSRSASSGRGRKKGKSNDQDLKTKSKTHKRKI